MRSVSDPSINPPSRREARIAAARTRRRRLAIPILVIALLLVGGGVGAAMLLSHNSTSEAKSAGGGNGTMPTTVPTTRAPSTTTSTTQAPGPGFVAGKVTAIGDSVMMDYQQALTEGIPGIDVQAGVSRQWGQGEQMLAGLKATNQLGATVIVGLSTNGPITTADMDQMMVTLAGASKVVLVNVHVDQPWQDPNNAVIAAAGQRYPTVVIVDWNALANEHPEWFGSDGTHLLINGTAAHALAAAVIAKAR